ncbi:hypothetical protein MC885_002125, partial [Smutsia gigantea]
AKHQPKESTSISYSSNEDSSRCCTNILAAAEKDKLSLLEKLLPERKEVEETDEMDQAELVDSDPNQERRRHYDREAHEDDDRHPRGGVQCQTLILVKFEKLVVRETWAGAHTTYTERHKA